MEWILVFGVPMFVTIPITAFLCRFWLRRKKRVSYGTMVVSVWFVTFICLVVLSEGRCFSLDYWSPSYGPTHKLGPEWPFSQLKLLGFIAAICGLPALGVVAYYQKRENRDATHVAKSPGAAI